jgi:hypothetical protein
MLTIAISNISYINICMTNCERIICQVGDVTFLLVLPYGNACGLHDTKLQKWGVFYIGGLFIFRRCITLHRL